MTEDSDKNRRTDLGARIDALESHLKKAEPAVSSQSQEALKASRVATEFAVAVLVCGALGWGADRMFNMAPLGLLVMVLVGFGVGLVNVWRLLGGYEGSLGWRKAKDKGN